jgi:hypothetical protein
MNIGRAAFQGTAHHIHCEVVALQALWQSSHADCTMPSQPPSDPHLFNVWVDPNVSA